MSQLLPTALMIWLVVACVLFALSAYQKSELRRWVSAASGTAAISSEQGVLLQRLANRFAWWNLLQHLAVVISIVCACFLIAYWVTSVAAMQVANAAYVYARM